MASRNNGDGPPDGKGAGDRPGSYVKIAGSRRRRRGRKQLPSTRPAPSAPTALAEPLEQDPAAGDASGESALDEPFEPPVDDLRGRPPASAGPRPVGPLGMDDARTPEGGSQSPSSVAHVRVIEINAQRGSDNTNDAASRPPPDAAPDDPLDSRAGPPPVEPRLAQAPAQMDEPFAPASRPPARPTSDEPDEDDDRFADDEELRAASEPPRAAPPESEPEYVPPAQLVGHQPGGDGFTMGHDDDAHVASEVQHTPRSGFSTVFNARASLRPSPPPPPRSALGWWMAILLLSSIIAAAGLVALREHREAEQEREAAARRGAAPAAPVAPPPAPEPEPEPPPAAAPATEPPVVVAPDAGTKRSAPAVKPVRAWKPRKQVPGDAGAVGAKPATPAGRATPDLPIESVPANPYGTEPGIR